MMKALIYKFIDKKGCTGLEKIFFQGCTATTSNRKPNEFYTKLKRVENGVY